MGRRAADRASPQAELTAQQLAVAHPAQAGFESARNAQIQYWRLQQLGAGGGLAGRGEAEQRYGRRHRQQQGGPMALEAAGSQTSRSQLVQVHTHRGARPGGEGMAQGRTGHCGLVAAAGPHHPADGPGHQHRRARTKQAKSGHGESDAAGPAAGVEGAAQGTHQGPQVGGRQSRHAA